VDRATFLVNFENLLWDNGDMFASCGNAEHDYNFITEVIGKQGFWSGTKYRYFFDNKLNFTHVEERVFGV
jgi:hypothetical protein